MWKDLEWRLEWQWETKSTCTDTAKLIENLTAVHGVPGSKHSLPIDPKFYEAVSHSTNQYGQEEFQQIVGGPLYIARTTRPEVSIHVNFLRPRTASSSLTNFRECKGCCIDQIATEGMGNITQLVGRRACDECRRDK